MFNLRVLVLRTGLCVVACVFSLASYAVNENLLSTIENWSQTSEADNSQFGGAVALTPKRLYIGAPYEDWFVNVSNTGNAGYALSYDTKTSEFVEVLNDGNVQVDNENCGFAISASTRNVIIGAPGKAIAGKSAAGAVYVRPGGTRAGVAAVQVDNPGPDVNDYFGCSVAIAGNAMVIGAKGDDTATVADAGQAFLGSAKILDAGIPLVDPNAAGGDEAGYAVAADKSYIVVGAPGRTVDGFAGAGAVAVYRTRDGAYLGTINNPNPHTNDHFGRAVAVALKLIYVGAPDADSHRPNSTTVDVGYVYQFSAVSHELIHEYSRENTNERIGASLSANGNYLLVGVPDSFYNPTTTWYSGQGGTYLFIRNKTNPMLLDGNPNMNTIRDHVFNCSPNPVVDGHFGAAVSVQKNGSYLVGAPGEGTNVRGRAYLFSKPSPDVIP